MQGWEERRKEFIKMKKVFIALIMCMFLISMVSALKIDYAKNDKQIDDMKVVFSDTILFGLIKTGEQGTMELKSHKTPNEVLKVGAGWQVTMIYDINFKDVYSNGLGDVTFYDMREKKEVERDYKFVYWGTETRQRDTYSCKESLNKNGTITQDCFISGKEDYTYEGWLDYNSKDIPQGKIKLGLMTYVKVDDYVDGIWEVQGKKIDKHASWTADLNTDLVSYYKLEETTGVVVDSLGTNNGTNNGATRGVTGKINNAFNFVSSGSDNVQISDDNSLNPSDEISVSVWFKPDSLGQSSYLVSKYFDGTTRDWEILLQNNDKAIFRISIGNSHQTLLSSNTASGTGWHHLVGTYNGSYQCTYLDNVGTCTVKTGSMDNSNADVFIGANNDIPTYTDGIIDEIGIWNRTLSSDEITQLYNGGSGISYTDVFGEVISLSPADDTTTDTQTVEFIGNTTYGDVVNFSLIINDTYEQTNLSGLSGNYSFTETLDEGVYSWKFESCDSIEGCANSTARTLTIELPNPEITLNSPVDTYNSTSQTIEFNATVTDNLLVENVSLQIDGSITQTNSSNVNGTYIFEETLADGDYNWSILAFDNDSQETQSTNRSFTVDTTNPTVFESNLTDLNANPLPINSTWSIDAYDLHLDQCYYNTSDDATQQIVTCNSTISDLEWATEGNKTIQYCANDTFGFETCLTDYIWVYEITDASFDNPDPIGEGFDATFNLTVNRTSIPTTTASLILNNTVYAVTGVAGTNRYYFETDVNIPTTWGSTTGNNVSWYWNYSISGVGDYNTTSENLTVYELGIDDCSAYGDVILDFSLNDEETNTAVNESNGANVEVDLRLTSKDNSDVYVDYNNTWTNENNPQVCIPSGLLSGGSQYTIDFTIGFQATDYVWEFYYLDGGTLNSTKVFDDYTDSTINLMDLLTTDSTSFLFNYFDEDGQTVPDAMIHVFRKYIGDGVFREVERAKLDTNGDTIVHLVEEDVIYYFVITDNGNTLFTTSQSTALCQATPCTMSIEASGDVAEFPTDYDLVENGAISFDEDKDTRTVTLTYLLNTSQEVNLTVYKYESDGSFTALDSSAENSIADTTGTITLSVPMSAGNVSFFSNVFIDGEYVDSEWIDFEENASDFFGSTLSIFLAVLIIMTLGLIAVTEGTGTIAFVILGVFLSGALGLLTTELSTGVNIVIYLVLAGGLIIWKVTSRRGG